MDAEYTAQQIAQWFINRAIIDANMNKGELLSNLKLQKLLYYAQGCYLALNNRPLFDDKILAWQHGPVVETIYRKYKDDFCINTHQDIEIDADTTAVLEQVYNIFGQFSAWKLRDMTHQEKPWTETPQSSEIEQDMIKSFFKRKYIKIS
jgi:uncharacterized phage-associated protein